MAVFSRIPDELSKVTCREATHPWNSSCALSAIDCTLMFIPGTSVFVLFSVLTSFVTKKTKEGVGWNSSDYEYLRKEFIIHLKSMVFAVIQGTISFSLVCSFRALLGKFYRPTMCIIPSFIGGLAVFGMNAKLRQTFSTSFANFALTIFQKRFEKSGVLRLARIHKVAIFMAMSAAISGLLNVLGTRSRDLKLFWFFDPLISKEKTSGCYHDQTCVQYITKGFLRSVTKGFILATLKILVKEAGTIFKSPWKVLQHYTKLSTYNLVLFFGVYALIYQSVCCLAQKLKGGIAVPDNVLSGALAGVAFILQPSSTILNLSIITAAQVLTKICKDAGILPKWPFAEINYAVCAGFIFDAIIVQNDCPPSGKFIIGMASMNRTNAIAQSVQKLINKP